MVKYRYYLPVGANLGLFYHPNYISATYIEDKNIKGVPGAHL